jgi:hypothetical protein
VCSFAEARVAGITRLTNGVLAGQARSVSEALRNEKVLLQKEIGVCGKGEVSWYNALFFTQRVALFSTVDTSMPPLIVFPPPRGVIGRLDGGCKRRELEHGYVPHDRLGSPACTGFCFVATK